MTTIGMQLLESLSISKDHLKKGGNTNIIGYSDVAWAGDASDIRSTSDYCVFIGENLISWTSKKKTIVARSSTKLNIEPRSMSHVSSCG